MHTGRVNTKADHDRAVKMIHNLHCDQGLSLRQAQPVMERVGLKRSLAALSGYLNEFECPHCSDPSPPPRPARPAAEPVRAQQFSPYGRGGGLADGLLP